MSAWVEGWSRPEGANRYHLFLAEQVKLCPDPGAAYRRGGVTHPAPVIPLGEPVPEKACATCSTLVEKLQLRPGPAPEDLPLVRGITAQPTRGQTRIELECQHQHSLVYVVDGAEGNWVCSTGHRPAHSLSGFFRELTELQDARIKELMNRWGLYVRPLPIREEEADGQDAEPPGGGQVLVVADGQTDRGDGPAAGEAG